jgi:dihydrofolate reductase
MNNNLVPYIASSQDDFISGESDDLSFLKSVEIEGEDDGYLKFVNSVGPILVGRKTYDKVISMGFPYHENKNVYVISRDKKNRKK